ncbi:acyl-coenzyme A thioesterase 13-like isoform X2 [Palaemon carinicauda]|uniref:acyl-coenzyme A thioesterase 13-like isoform X2 n=1 Tax=Palaemon carinicauda TaxID=392227 RepID=UPI0035B5B8DD
MVSKCIVRVISGGGGKCVAEMTVEEEHQNRGGTLHGGLTATLVDVVSTAALMTTEKAVPGVSVDLNVSYISAAQEGDSIVINADTLKVGRTLAFLTVDITNKDSGKLIAKGSHTKYIG